MLIEALGGVRCLALVGIGKNVGKTTALNVLVQEAHALKLGLTSIGRDGELLDAITAHAKPPIAVPVGSLVATVESALPGKTRAYRVLERTEERTALGPVVIAESLIHTTWEVTGPSTHAGLERVRDRMHALGADLVILDGAFDRRSAATPALSDATILVSGAALDPDLAKVVAETAHLVELFSLPTASLCAEAHDLLQRRRTAVDLQELAVTSALGAAELIAAAVRPETRQVLVGTALTQGLLEALEPRAASFELVLRDPTCALVSAAALKRYRARGGRIAVARRVHLPLIVANPYSPYGWRFGSEELLGALAQALAPLPIVDVVAQVTRLWGGGV